MSANNGDTAEVGYALQKMNAQWTKKLSSAMTAMLAQNKGGAYDAKARLSHQKKGHAALERLEQRAKCELCVLTLDLDDEFKNSMPYTQDDERLFTDYQCAQCGLALHPSCAWYWHERKAPYSRFVTGVFEKSKREWPVAAPAAESVARVPSLLYTDDPSAAGRDAMRSALGSNAKWHEGERLYTVTGDKAAHEFSRSHDNTATDQGPCELCKLTQASWPVAGERATRRTPYKCHKCDAFLHIECYSAWHEERVPHSRVVWRLRSRATGCIMDDKCATALQKSLEGLKSNGLQKRLSRPKHKL
eukprot:3305734-Rhodomonas_salina.1